MKTLPSQTLTDAYWTDIEAQIKSIFYEVVFAPIIKIIRSANPQEKGLVELLNAKTTSGPLLAALRSGRVQYTNGRFSGEFNVAIVRVIREMGASVDIRTNSYYLAPRNTPAWVLSEASGYQSKAKYTHELILGKLNEIQEHLDQAIESHPVDADDAIRHVEKGFKRSAEMLKVDPKMTPAMNKMISKHYTKNLNKYITDFSKQSITTLREVVQANALEGYRFDRLTEVIRHRYGVTANKAKFLARQETSLFMSKYRQARFTEAGVKRYRWSTAHDERVRSSHRALNGQVFSYDQPPITDTATGAHNNPGEDFNCRCIDIPILEKSSDLD